MLSAMERSVGGDETVLKSLQMAGIQNIRYKIVLDKAGSNGISSTSEVCCMYQPLRDYIENLTVHICFRVSLLLSAIICLDMSVFPILESLVRCVKRTRYPHK